MFAYSPQCQSWRHGIGQRTGKYYKYQKKRCQQTFQIHPDLGGCDLCDKDLQEMTFCLSVITGHCWFVGLENSCFFFSLWHLALEEKTWLVFSAAVFGDLGGVMCANFWLCELVLA